MNIIIKNGFVFDSAAGDEHPEKKDILIADGNIAGLGEGIPVPPGGDLQVIDAAGKLVIPGLINAHLHSHDHFDRGRFENLPLELWILFIRPWIGAKPLTPRELYLRTVIGAMEKGRMSGNAQRPAFVFPPALSSATRSLPALRTPAYLRFYANVPHSSLSLLNALKLWI